MKDDFNLDDYKQYDPINDQRKKLKFRDLLPLDIIIILAISLIIYTQIRKDNYSRRQIISPDRELPLKKEMPIVSNWYDGGTLQKAKVSEWKISSSKNKLATCADFVVRIYKKDEKTIKSIDELKIPATNLMICIDEAVSGSNNTDEMSVAEIAASCSFLIDL